MKLAVRSIIRFTLLEAWRSRWLAMCLAAAVITGSLAAFAGAMAITEREAVMLNVAAIGARLGCVALVILMTVSACVREAQERTLAMVLAAPLPRTAWVAARACGLSLVAMASALILSIPVWLLNPSWGVLVWTLSLMLEVCLVALVSMTVALAFRQFAAAVFGSAAFYIAARVIGLVQMLNERSPLEAQASQARVGGFVDTLALVLPRLDLFTSSAWALPGAAALSPSGLGLLVLQVGIYSAILIATASFDLTRKDQVA